MKIADVRAAGGEATDELNQEQPQDAAWVAKNNGQGLNLARLLIRVRGDIARGPR
jgi:hypothetical protein